MLKSTIAGLTAISLLAACQPQNGAGTGIGGTGVTKSNIGTIAGAALGGWAGHNVGSGSGQTVATIAGTLLGAALGTSLGESLDNADMAAQHQTASRALESAPAGQTLPWSTNNAAGTVTPSGYYQTAQGQYCREYSQTITVSGRTERGYGTACRQADGSWQIVQ